MVATFFLLLFAATPQTPGASAQCRPGDVQIRVTDRAGRPLASAHVRVQGVTERDGETNRGGCVTFNKLKAGMYLVRVDRDDFITLEKAFRVVPGRSAGVVAALSPVATHLTAPSGR
jgi:hypothetical protein